MSFTVQIVFALLPLPKIGAFTRGGLQFLLTLAGQIKNDNYFQFWPNAERPLELISIISTISR